MDRETLLEAIRKGPVIVHMNDGSKFEIPSMEFAVVGNIGAYVLVKDADGKLRGRHLALVCMVQIEELAEA